MKAIVTKFLGQTSTKPNRIVARAEGVRPVTINVGFLDTAQAELSAARALCVRQQWTGALTRASLPNGDTVFVFTPALDALVVLAHAVVYNTMPDTNPYSRPQVKQAMKAIKVHTEWTGDWLDTPLDLSAVQS